MQAYVYDTNNGSSVEDFQIREDLITKLKNRFTTYGYKQVRTSTFEYYDLYASLTGTVNKDDMIKVIDSSGKVLVLRPDVTIPITRMTTLSKNRPSSDVRYFYVLEVFRQSSEQNSQKENTQAGVEYFGKNSPEVDAEVIMLAIHTLKDQGFSNFKIEIGHAGFFKELISQASISESELEQLQSLIQSKNIVEMDPFLKNLPIEDDLRSAIKMIPLLYGNPGDVIQQAKENILNEKMQLKLQNLIDVFEVLEDYGIADSVVFNLGLINNMNYYTDIIFQGFIDNVGKPVLMGGRYDHLGDQYGSSLPAIGFAFEVDLLLHALLQQGLSANENSSADIIIFYEKEKQREALVAAYSLRNRGYQVITFPSNTTKTNYNSSTYTVCYEKTQNLFLSNDSKQFFSDSDELLLLLQLMKEEI